MESYADQIECFFFFIYFRHDSIRTPFKKKKTYKNVTEKFNDSKSGSQLILPVISDIVVDHILKIHQFPNGNNFFLTADRIFYRIKTYLELNRYRIKIESEGFYTL